ncbi:MAG: hypothetical protein JWN76_935 [Chitinophagaceae bacterium]|nr:hypothetical protein [Chitinophagaceae bacterium]
MKKILTIVVIFLTGPKLYSQDTLPKFTVQDLGNNRIRISWVNPFPYLTQLNIQRSYDSSNYFRTIFLAQSPELPQNGFIDNYPQGYKYYYRIFYANGATYNFTIAKRPGGGFENRRIVTPPPYGRGISIKVKDSVYLRLSFEDYQSFRDSIITKTRDSLFTLGADEVLLKPYIARDLWRQSPFVYINKDGYLNIQLPLAKDRHYKVIIYDADGSELFQIKNIKEPFLTLDKANFMHAGWFFFELFDDDKLKEKNKFYLQRDF